MFNVISSPGFGIRPPKTSPLFPFAVEWLVRFQACCSCALRSELCPAGARGPVQGRSSCAHRAPSSPPGCRKGAQTGRSFWGQRACSGWARMRRVLDTHPSRKDVCGTSVNRCSRRPAPRVCFSHAAARRRPTARDPDELQEGHSPHGRRVLPHTRPGGQQSPGHTTLGLWEPLAPPGPALQHPRPWPPSWRLNHKA